MPSPDEKSHLRALDNGGTHILGQPRAEHAGVGSEGPSSSDGVPTVLRSGTPGDADPDSTSTLGYGARSEGKGPRS